MTETELKLTIDAATAASLWRRARAADLTDATPRPRFLRTVYYDAADLRLRKAGASLRMRRDGRRWIQTVKAKSGLHAGLSRAAEWEAPAPGGRINLSLIDDAATRERMERLIGADPLEPVCETAFKRASGIVRAPGGATAAEMAVDVGEIIAGPHAAKFWELEIELTEGAIDGLFAIARALIPDSGLSFSRLSKAERGYLLAEEGRIAVPVAPQKATRPPIPRRATAERAGRDILRAAVAQIAANYEVVQELDDPGGPKQLRVGLRRFRSALSVFRPALGGPAATRLGEEAKWLAGEVAAVRDLDVARDDVVAPAAAADPAETGYARLHEALEAAVAPARETLRETLKGERAQVFLLDLAAFTEARGWLDPADLDQTLRLARPAQSLAKAALDKARRHSARRAVGLAGLSIDDRHELRKSLKRQRYAVEFLRTLYDPDRVAPYLATLKALQEVFGALNDLAMAEMMFTGPNAIAAEDADAQRAVGRILGASAARAEMTWADASELWRAFVAQPAFWR